VSATSESENRSVSLLGFPQKSRIYDSLVVKYLVKRLLFSVVLWKQEEVPKDITEEEQEGESESGNELYRLCTEQEHVRVT
jgi:hypothetical protein